MKKVCSLNKQIVHNIGTMLVCQYQYMRGKLLRIVQLLEFNTLHPGHFDS